MDERPFSKHKNPTVMTALLAAAAKSSDRPKRQLLIEPRLEGDNPLSAQLQTFSALIGSTKSGHRIRQAAIANLLDNPDSSLLCSER